VRAYLAVRAEPGETFLHTVRRTGLAPFKTALYENEGAQDAA